MKTLNLTELSKMYSDALKNNGATAHIPKGEEVYLVGITKDFHHHKTEFTMDEFQYEGVDMLDNFQDETTKNYNNQYPDITFGIWWDDKEDKWIFNVVQAVKNKWEAVQIAHSHSREEIGISKNGEYAGSIEVAKYIRVALNAVKNSGQTIDADELDDCDRMAFGKICISHSVLKAPSFPMKDPKLDIDVWIHPLKENKLSDTALLKFQDYGNGEISVEFPSNENMAKFAVYILRTLGYNPLNILPEEGV